MHLIFCSEHGSPVHFKVLPATLLQRVFNAYACKVSMQPAELRFIWTRNILDGRRAVQHYDIEDQDTVDVMVGQTGD